jgi:hypothetical protein
LLGREVRDREGLRRPRHQLLDKFHLAEGGPGGKIVIVHLVVVVLVAIFFTLPSAIRPVGLSLAVGSN